MGYSVTPSPSLSDVAAYLAFQLLLEQAERALDDGDELKATELLVKAKVLLCAIQTTK
jgi:hypothetical protein